ncbi:MAG: PrsW family intramembrane metalloprotease [Clostridia bacterium]|nr:PrsW family intramembrane metalloprotease [Clostridia bacterium]
MRNQIKVNGEVERAKITYFFKETFRAHSKAEYKEIFTRGLNEDNSGVSGAFPWLYVRAFFALLILFTVNTFVLRLTNNALYVPSVTFLGGITFTVPFIILLYELYPKRDLSLFFLIAVLVIGGTVSGFLAQLGYTFIPKVNDWISAVTAGVVEEVCKLIPALVVIAVIKQKNPYACFLIAATVGAGFSVIEDMGYIFYFSDNSSYHSDVSTIVTLFADRGLSSFCSHVLWTGAIGWAYSYIKKPFKSIRFFLMIFLSISLHICWDFPLEGWLQVLDIGLCVIIAACVNIAIVHVSRMKTLANEVDLTAVNEGIIAEAKQMGGRMRFTNAANLTFALTCTLLSVLLLVFCVLPIGTDYKREEYGSKEEFIAVIQDHNDLVADWDRQFDDNGETIEELKREGKRVYAVQRENIGGYDYDFSYYFYDNEVKLDSIAVWVEFENRETRFYCFAYEFGKDVVWVFEVNDYFKDYKYQKDGTVTAVTYAEEFNNYDLLIVLCATGCAITICCTVVLAGLRIKIRRLKDA